MKESSGAQRGAASIARYKDGFAPGENVRAVYVDDMSRRHELLNVGLPP